MSDTAKIPSIIIKNPASDQERDSYHKIKKEEVFSLCYSVNYDKHHPFILLVDIITVRALHFEGNKESP